jgi:lysozyme
MQLDAAHPWWRALDAQRQRVMINLGFNLGVPKLSTFNTFLDLMQKHDFEGAATDLEGTAWYEQVGERGPRMVQRLLAGLSHAA